ncbi:MAG: flagellar hook-basal body complex protein FliE [Planctomycetaceae bacterium]
MTVIRGPQNSLPPLAINPPAVPLPPAPTGGVQGGDTASFKDFLLQSIGHVNNMQQEADKAVQQFLTGGDVNPAEVLTSIQKSDMTFRLMLQIRNKLVQAYQEVSNIRI